MSFLFKKLLAAKAAKAAALKPAIKPAPVEKVCNISAAREKLIQKKIDALEAKAAKLDAKAESVRDHYQDKADGIRDLYEKKADFYSCKGGRLGEKFAAKFSALGDKKASLLETLGEKKAFALECASDKLKAKADLLREKLAKDEDPSDDDLDDEDDDDIIDDDGDDNGDETGSELPEDTASVKFFLDVEEDNGLNYMYYLTIQAGDGDEEFTLDDAYEQALAYLDERNLELKDLTQVDIQNADGEKIAEYQFVDGEFVKVGEAIDGLWVETSEDDLAANLDDEDEDESVGG
ncbi:MAG: hypothetical protein JJU08_11280 [Rhodobacteraceae bacterium]|nr:hypothetical protein [Paracoccaceae bacterium]